MLPVFQPRTTAPDVNDENWIPYRVGGRNYCLSISKDSVLPNCVGYVYGRWLELLHDFHQLGRGNAENWWSHKDQYYRGQVPKLGAIACWRKGAVGDGTDGAGHVAVVEDVLGDGSIVTSNSAYLGSRFYMRTIKHPYNIGKDYTFQGFIYLPIEYQNAKPLLKPAITVAKEVIAGEWGDGPDRKARLSIAGYNYDRIQTVVNDLLKYNLEKEPKSLEVVAQEIVDGKWGNGFIRKNALIKAGYDYNEVQVKVVQLLATKKPKKLLLSIAKEVIAGSWGNGLDRKNALIKAGYDYKAVQMAVNNLLK